MDSGLVEEDGWSARFETDLADEHVIAVLSRGGDSQLVGAVLESSGRNRKSNELVILIAHQLAQAFFVELQPPGHLDNVYYTHLTLPPTPYV